MWLDGANSLQDCKKGNFLQDKIISISLLKQQEPLKEKV